MLLLSSQREIYQKNPLIGVTCQFDFPAILQIDTELPAAYQERIRKEYPIFQETRGIKLPPQVGQIPLRLGSAKYEFLDGPDEEAVWRVTLTQSTLALSTSRYERWETFKERLVSPLTAFVDIYAPAYFSRCGLRYQNLIRRSELGIEKTRWAELLNQQLAGMFLVVEDETSIEGTQTLAVIRLREGPLVRLQHGLLIDQADNERCYLIDNDFYIERRTEVTDAYNIINSLNNASGRFFRWCITDQLHAALEPVAV